MGNACTRASVQDASAIPRTQKTRNETLQSQTWSSISVGVECFCMPAMRLIPFDYRRSGPAANCKSVAVVTITIDTVSKPETNTRSSSKLNSALYTPVLQWFGVDIKEQVPKYLPMNLWAGKYTVFGFYNPEQSGSSYVNFSAKIGSEDVCIDQVIELKKEMNYEERENLKMLLQTELSKIKSQSSEPQTVVKDEKRSLESTPTQRDSLDTGYMSHKKSTDMSSPYPMRYVHTSDSDEQFSKLKEEKDILEKKSMLRRKDTPAYGLFKTSSMPHNDFKRMTEGSPLKEETESSHSPGSDLVLQGLPLENRPFSDPMFSCTPESENAGKYSGITEAYDQETPKDGERSIGRMRSDISKSFQDIREFTEVPLSPISYQEVKMTKPRKKRSIGSKLSRITPEDRFLKPPNMESRQHLNLDVEDDADDEGEISLTEHLPHNGSEQQISTESEKQNITEQQSFKINDQSQINLEKQSQTRNQDVNSGTNISSGFPLNVDSLCCSDNDIVDQPDVKDNCEVKNTTDSKTNRTHNTRTSSPKTESEVIKTACDARLQSHEEKGDERCSLSTLKQSESIEICQPEITEEVSQKSRFSRSRAEIKVKLSSKSRTISSIFSDVRNAKQEEKGDQKKHCNVLNRNIHKKSRDESSSDEEEKQISKAKRSSGIFALRQKSSSGGNTDYHSDRYKRHIKSVSVLRRRDSEMPTMATQKTSLDNKKNRALSTLGSPGKPKEAFCDN